MYFRFSKFRCSGGDIEDHSFRSWSASNTHTVTSKISNPWRRTSARNSTQIPVKLSDNEHRRDSSIRSPLTMSSSPRPCCARSTTLSARRHPAQLHLGQPQGLVQKRLRGHQPAPHQYLQPERYDVIIINAKRQVELKTGADQPTPRDAADRGLQGRPRNGYANTLLIHAALHR